MNFQMLTDFFMWCTIIGAVFLVLAAMMSLFFMDFVYRIQSRWFSISRDAFNIVIYSFIGLFKILWVIFNLIPYLALLAMT